MDIKPVSQIEAPAYPTRDELLADRRALHDCLPSRWRKTKGLAGALSLFLAANCSGGCGFDAGGGVPRKADTTQESSDPFADEGDAGHVVSDSAEENDPGPLVEEAADWIYSIFGGRAAMTGCIAMMPPAVLHEDAAVQAAHDSGK